MRRIKRAPKVIRAYGGKIVLWPVYGGWFYEVRSSRRYRPPRRQFGGERFPRFILNYTTGYASGSTETLAAARQCAVNGLKVQYERRAAR